MRPHRRGAEEALRVLLVGTGLAFHPLNERTFEIHLQPNPVAESASVTADPLSEIEINAAREKLWRMRAEIRDLEARFFEKYNALNTDDDFDIYCSRGAKHFSGLRRCSPGFVANRVELRGGGGLLGGSGGSADAGMAAIPATQSMAGSAPGPGFTWVVPFGEDLAKWKAYEKHVLELINRYPQLRQLVSEREELEKRYKRIRAEKLKRSFIVQ